MPLSFKDLYVRTFVRSLAILTNKNRQSFALSYSIQLECYYIIITGIYLMVFTFHFVSYFVFFLSTLKIRTHLLALIFSHFTNVCLFFCIFSLREKWGHSLVFVMCSNSPLLSRWLLELILLHTRERMKKHTPKTTIQTIWNGSLATPFLLNSNCFFFLLKKNEWCRRCRKLNRLFSKFNWIVFPRLHSIRIKNIHSNSNHSLRSPKQASIFSRESMISLFLLFCLYLCAFTMLVYTIEPAK